MINSTKSPILAPLIVLPCLLSCGTDGPVENTPTIASLDLSPSNHTLQALGDTITLTATARAQDGSIVTDVNLSWNTLHGTIVSVTQTGLVTGLGNGAATIEVRGGGQLAKAIMTVEQRAVALSAVTPAFGVVDVPMPPVQISIVDAQDNVVPWASAVVSVEGVGAAVSGQTVDTIEAGSVQLDSLVVNELTHQIALRFTASGLAEETTALFDVTTLTFESVSAGTVRTCAIDSDHRAWCWGTNSSGSLGVEGGLEGGIPRWAVRGLEFQSVTAGDAGVACGISPEGNLYCWGDPDPPVAEPWLPRLIAPQLIWTAVHPSRNHSCALAEGDAWCWGHNRFGELGNGSTVESLTPGLVSGGPFTKLHVGLYSTCGIDGSNALYCWGENIGFVTTDAQPQYETPLHVLDTLEFLDLGGWGSRICGVSIGLELVCFGDSPIPTDLENAPTMSTFTFGDNHMCGLTPDGEAFCWGENASGQLGDGMAGVNRETPALVGGGLTFQSIAAGSSYTCAVTTGGLLYCWGLNNFGQLGDGTETNRAVPTLVLGQQ